MATTIYDIADKLSISHSTVSRVLNNRGAGFISEKTRRRVLQASEEMGYRPNMSARALVTGKTGNIAVWSAELTRPYYAQVVQALEKQIGAHGYKMILRSGNDIPTDSTWLRALETTDADGIVAIDVYYDQRRAALEPDAKIKQPCVFVGVYQPAFADYVRVDLHDATVDGVRAMLAAGCRRIAFVASNRHIAIHEQRQRAYIDTVRAAGMEPLFVEIGGSERSFARSGFHEYARTHELPDGLLCFNDEIAIGAYRALRELGARVPDDVKIVGCDGIEEIEYLDTPLSTVAQPIEEMCAVAWGYLSARIADPSAPFQRTTLPAHLVSRQSASGDRTL
ncbi:MAG TPA: LacI family DNA-binding transcriptional regulator [Capsulimonadaceae bacterium]|jgi:LacI family transcriptional regulator